MTSSEPVDFLLVHIKTDDSECSIQTWSPAWFDAAGLDLEELHNIYHKTTEGETS